MVRTQVLTIYEVFTTKQTICTKTYNCWIVYENIQMLKGTLIITTILLFESRKITSNLKHDSYINLPDSCMNVCTI